MILYNSITRKKEPFTPLDPKHVKMYVCGPTVYDRAHIGNARPVVVFDVLFRMLKHLYDTVTYVRNITDIDDKIMTAAAKKQVSIQHITTENTRFYNEDMTALGALPPTQTPKATEHIQEMIQMIEDLIQKKFAYAKDGHVVFDVERNNTYGKLSRLNLDDQISGARVEVAPYKKNPQDFVLWKPSDDTQPGWDSPWGRGRPGWHIECSAMVKKHLGKTFDIHGGGIDLIFPHHENEIAQSECCHDGSPFARYWMHNGHLIVNGEKMSKSLGNFFTVEELRDTYAGEAIRLTLLSAHYRQPLDWRPEVVAQSTAILDRFYTALEGCPDAPGTVSDAFLNCLKDDLNVPEALSQLHTMVSNIHKEKDLFQKQTLQRNCKASANLLGLLESTAENWFQGTESDDVLWIEDMIEKRHQAKKNKDFKEADTIRDKLREKGILLEDTSNGTTWKRK